MSGNGILNPNTIAPLSTATTLICTYPFRIVRKDMSQNEYLQTKMDWYQFDKVWAYNYSVSTLNGNASRKVYSPYYFLTNNEKNSYARGQIGHIEAYSSIAKTGFFNNILG